MRAIRLLCLFLIVAFAIMILWKPALVVGTMTSATQRLADVASGVSPGSPHSGPSHSGSSQPQSGQTERPATPRPPAPGGTPAPGPDEGIGPDEEGADQSDAAGQESAGQEEAAPAAGLGLDAPAVPDEAGNAGEAGGDGAAEGETPGNGTVGAGGTTGRLDAPIPLNLRAAGFEPAFATFPALDGFTDATPAVLAGKFEQGPALGLVGGTVDAIVDVPWIVGVRKRRQENDGAALATSICGGAVFARRWVVTAAHCLDDDYNVLEIIAGASDLDSENVIRRVSRRAFIHAGYERASLRDDVAVIALDQAMPPFIPDAPFPTQAQLGQIPSVTRVIGRGFGVTENGFDRNFLKKVELAVLEEGTGYRVIRVADPEGDVEGLCEGDSGSPVEGIVEGGDNFIIGMVSFNEASSSGALRCTTPSFPAGIVSLEGYMESIRALVNLCTASPEMCFGDEGDVR